MNAKILRKALVFLITLDHGWVTITNLFRAISKRNQLMISISWMKVKWSFMMLKILISMIL